MPASLRQPSFPNIRIAIAWVSVFIAFLMVLDLETRVGRAICYHHHPSSPWTWTSEVLEKFIC